MSSGVNMSDNEVEEVSFLPGESAVSKRAVYEPSRVQRCRQLVCSRAAAVSLLVLMALFLLLLALVAALARPASTTASCPSPGEQGLVPTTPPPAKEKTYIATNGEPFPWRDIRLPRSVVPSLYTLQLHVNISTSIFQGQVKIALKVVSRTDFLVIHLKDLNVTHFYVTSQTKPSAPLRVTKNLIYPENEQMLLKLDRDLEKDEEVTVHIEFKAALVKKLNGLYKSSYKTAKGEERDIVATHFEPVAARSAFPCLDEPALKANFSVSLVREPRHVALFNTPLASTRQLGDGLLVDQFQTTVQMSTYLVALVISDFKSIENTTSQGVKVRVFAPEDQIGQAEYALQSAVKILDYYNSFFGVPYPLPKQDLVAIPDFEAGAMENWGLILYRMSSLLYHPQKSTRASKQWVCTVIAHELAHQWFGNLVTMEWWDDLWLNEGFASLVEYIGCNFNEPDLKLLELFEVDALHTAFIMDSLSNSHPIHVAVSNPESINELFDKISYDKGASILRMLREVLGEENFHEGLKAYLNTYKYGNARTDQLWEALQQHVGEHFQGMSVKAMMDTWTKQMNFPVVTATRQGTQLQISQERFLSNPEAATTSDQSSPFHYKWYIPFTYVVSESPSTGSQQLVWLNLSSAQAPLPPSTTWVKGNVGAFGVYRVNYDADNWRALSDQLLKGHEIFSYADRASLLDDAFAFGRSGTASPVVSLNLTRYLVGETHYVPWRIALMGLGFLKRRLTGTDAFASFKSYMLDLMSRQLTSLGWEDKGNSLDIYLRQTLLFEAIRLGHKESILKGKQLFVDLKKNASSVPVNLQRAVLLAGVMHGLEEDWDWCWQRYQHTQVATEKTDMLTALTYTQDLSLLSTLLTRLLAGSIPVQDGGSVLTLVAANPSGSLLAWHFLQEHWDTVLHWYGSGTFSMSKIILGLTSGFDSEFDLKQVEAFFTGRDVGSGKRAVQQGLETISMNLRWRRQFEKEVADWLTAAAAKKPTTRAV